MVLLLISVCILIVTTTIVDGFTPSSPSFVSRRVSTPLTPTLLYNTVDNDTDKVSSTTEGAFVPLNDESVEEDDDDDEDDEDVLDKVEMFGKGAAKVRTRRNFSTLFNMATSSTNHFVWFLYPHNIARSVLISIFFRKKAKRGKRKGSTGSSKTPVVKAALVPEEVYYEGPPALSETFLPTLSILTVVGIIPAAASWARQAWVRYKITNRRIRVNSGIGGNDMSEIIYPDIIEIRTVKRLFGDGDMVCYLRDGAKFEMRNIPEFDAAMEFMLKQCNEDVVAQYRSKGDVGRG